MSKIILAGISGIGKSFLESELNRNHNFDLITKYTNRPYRPGEENDPIIESISDEQFDEMRDDFISVIEQTGNKYGYKIQDVINSDNCAFSVPMKDIEAHVAKMEDLVPILLYVKPENLDLVENRMRSRLEIDKLDEKQKYKTLEKIKIRMDLAKSDLNNLESVKLFVESKSGRAFEIKDDSTVFKEVIPFINSL